MKTRSVYGTIITITLLMLVSVLSNVCWSQEYKEITVSGTADIVRDNEDQAKKLAVQDALRTAVEMGVGVVIQSRTEVKDFELIKDEIKSNAEGFVKEYDIIKEAAKDGKYNVTLKAKVLTERINEAFKKRLGKAAQALGNPSITFVLTTWKKIAERGGFESRTAQVDVSAKRRDQAQIDGSIDEESGSYRVKGAVDSSKAIDASAKVTKSSTSAMRLSEIEWKKFPDMTIIDSFNQEFKEKSFDLMAADEARKIAQAESLASTSIDVFDREQVRKKAEKEGANFVARGEVQIIDYRVSESTGKPVVTSKVGVEIIDVNSGDIVGAYSDTTSATSSSRQEAEAQAIKKIAVLAARTLAGQTLETWEKRGTVGQFYTIEVRNITNIRQQQRPLIKAIESVATIRQQTNPTDKVLLMQVSFKGAKNKLGDAILDKLEGDKTPGFSEKEFEGPSIVEGKIVFKFMK